MVETPPETGPESRGGEQPDWASVQPGEPLPGLAEPETAATGEDG